MPTVPTPENVTKKDLDDAIAKIIEQNGNMEDGEYRKWIALLLGAIRSRLDGIEKILRDWTPRLDNLEKNSLMMIVRKSTKNFIWFILITSGYFTFVHDINPWIFNHVKYVFGKIGGLF